MTLTVHRRPLAALAALTGFLAGAGNARALTFAEGLDTPGVEWTSSGPGTWVARATAEAHDGVDLAEVATNIDKEGSSLTPTLSTPVTGPAVVRFWWRYVTAVTDPSIYVGVDDVFAYVPVRYPDNNGWMPVEVQLSAGPHTLGLRPFEGTNVQVDQVTITPGPGSAVQAAGNPALSWILPYGGIWKTGTDAPPGLPASMEWAGGMPYLTAYCLVPPHSKVEGWFKMVTPGYFMISAGYRAGRAAWPEWQRFRLVSPDPWVTFTAYGMDDAAQNASDLKLAGLTVSPAGPGDILDAPELPWTVSDTWPFTPQGDENGEHGTGSFLATGNGDFSTGLHTTLTGPGRLFFTSLSFPASLDRWEILLNEEVTTLRDGTNGTWVRHAVPVPAGAVSAEFRAINSDPDVVDDWGYFLFDDVTMCAPASTPQKDALDLPAGAEMWIRQSGAGQWSRSTAVSRDGVDSLALAPSPDVRRVDLMLPTNGANVVGMWIKTIPETALTFSPFGEGMPNGIWSIHPVPDANWKWLPVRAGPETTDLRVGVSTSADIGGEVYLDGYASYKTVVPVADALDTPGRVWDGNFGLALPGSDAEGGKAVVIPAFGEVVTSVSGPVRIKYRYRFCASPAYVTAQIIIGGDTLAELGVTAEVPNAPLVWQDGELLYFTGQPTPVSFRCDAGMLMLDTVEIHLLAASTIPEALDAPGLTVGQEQGWKGFTGLGHDGIDAVVSPELVRLGGAQANNTLQSQLVMNVPATGSVDGGFWWSRKSNATVLEFAIAADAGTPYWWSYSGTGWQQVRLHRDRAPGHLSWTQAWYQPGTPTPTIPAGNAMVDQLQLVNGETDVFSKALDTDPDGRTVAATGWDALGDADVRVENTVTWQGGDALAIRPVPGGAAVQSTQLTGRFSGGTDFACRVKRGAAANASLTVIILGRSFAQVPLTAEWTEFRTLLPAPFATGQYWITLLATVPDAGPDAVIYLDAVSVTESTDYNAALETTGLTWTGSGQGRQSIGAELIEGQDQDEDQDQGGFPAYRGYFDGVSFLDLTNGQRRSLDTVMTGPGIVVLAGYRHPGTGGTWRTSLLVDGMIRDSVPEVMPGPFQLQTVLPAGVHTVRWRVERDADSSAGPGALQLHSAALVPGEAGDLLFDALESITPGRAWAPGGSHPPTPLYSLTEGVTALNGIFLPALSFGETSWIETAVTGPARVNFTWQSAVLAACYMDGRTAYRTRVDPGYARLPDPHTTMEVPAGPHTLRWAASTGGTAKLRAFAATPGSDIAGVLAGASPPIAWIYEPEASWPYRWQVMTDDTLTGYDSEGQPVEVPGTGLPVLGAGGQARGFFWVTGPAIVSFDFRRLNVDSLIVGVGPSTWFPLLPDREFVDLHWHADAIVVPTGQYPVSFLANDYGEDFNAGDPPTVWLRNIRIQPGLQWLTWAYGLGLIAPDEASPYADPDHDGVSNLLEYAFGTQPRHASGETAPALTGPPENRRLQFPALPWDAPGLTYEVQSSADLLTWTTLATVSARPPGQPGPSVSLPAPENVRSYYRVVVRPGNG